MNENPENQPDDRDEEKREKNDKRISYGFPIGAGLLIICYTIAINETVISVVDSFEGRESEFHNMRDLNERIAREIRIRKITIDERLALMKELEQMLGTPGVEETLREGGITLHHFDDKTNVYMTEGREAYALSFVLPEADSKIPGPPEPPKIIIREKRVRGEEIIFAQTLVDGGMDGKNIYGYSGTKFLVDDVHLPSHAAGFHFNRLLRKFHAAVRKGTSRETK